MVDHNYTLMDLWATYHGLWMEDIPHQLAEAFLTYDNPSIYSVS